MRLIKVPKTGPLLYIEFEEVADHESCTYAILSHTWNREEITYADVERQNYKSKQGWRKVSAAMETARADKLEYLWIDTCCIDKTSSAELSEAINSMYKWYQVAHTCSVYLEDVSCKGSDANFNTQFRAARWFTRGWTLQEFLAPLNVVFYNQNWDCLGTKDTLVEKLALVTKIDRIYILGYAAVVEASISRRMSWAALRTTTRREDIAYCMMGIFNVNMPLLYGEGDRAFQRLQEEILRSTNDQTLLAWNHEGETLDSGFVDYDYELSQALAPSPRHFDSSGEYVPVKSTSSQTTFRMTNRGLEVDLYLDPEEFPRGYFRAELACWPVVSISLKSTSPGSGEFIRCRQKLLRRTRDDFRNFREPRRIICLVDTPTSSSVPHVPYFCLDLRVSYTEMSTIPVVDSWCLMAYQEEPTTLQSLLSSSKRQNFVGGTWFLRANLKLPRILGPVMGIVLCASPEEVGSGQMQDDEYLRLCLYVDERRDSVQLLALDQAEALSVWPGVDGNVRSSPFHFSNLDSDRQPKISMGNATEKFIQEPDLPVKASSRLAEPLGSRVIDCTLEHSGHGRVTCDIKLRNGLGA